MGTRGCWGFRVNGEDKLTYNHFDSYLSGLGNDLLKDLKDMDFDVIRDEAEMLEVVQGDTSATAEQIEVLKCYADEGVSSGNLNEWYVLLRNTQGDLHKTLDAGVMVDGKDFINDSVMCEWAYIINLDDNLFEIYKGFQDQPHVAGRYADGPTQKVSYEARTYYPCALIKTYKLEELPENFAELEAELEKEE